MPIRGLRSIAYETGKSVYDNDFMNSEWAVFMPEGHVGLKNVMFAPLNVDGKTVGLMGLANKPTDFTEHDTNIAGVLGDLAAIALRNSRYIELLGKRTEELQDALKEISVLSVTDPLTGVANRRRFEEAVRQEYQRHMRSGKSLSIIMLDIDHFKAFNDDKSVKSQTF